MRTLFLISLLFTLNACGLLDLGIQKDTVQVKSWDPSGVKIECPSGDCPEAVGLLVTKKSTSGGYQLGRCTASLIETDKILTNAHCFEMNEGYETAYFLAPTKGGNVIRRVSRILFKMHAKVAATGRDHAIAQLDRPVTELAPKSLARSIPEDLTQLIGFVMNQTTWDSDFVSFTLDKRVCRVTSKYVLFGLDLNSRGESLALFDCEMKQGNSGAPLFAKGDYRNIQVILWGIVKKDHSSEAIRYAMAERVHCLEYIGIAAPEVLCTKYNEDKSIKALISEATAEQVKLASDRVSGNGVVYDLETLVGQFEKSSEGRKGLALLVAEIPKCRLADDKDFLRSGIPSRITYYESGVNQNGELDIQEARTQNLTFHYTALESGHYMRQTNLFFVLDMPWSFSLNYDATSSFRRHFEEQNVKLPVCTGSEEAESLEKFKAALK